VNAAPRRLALPHFAYLRAWVEGVPREEAARRYLGLEHGHALVTLHRQVVDELRAVARRRGDSRGGAWSGSISVRNLEFRKT
jgi:hypothetical protein